MGPSQNKENVRYKLQKKKKKDLKLKVRINKSKIVELIKATTKYPIKTFEKYLKKNVTCESETN